MNNEFDSKKDTAPASGESLAWLLTKALLILVGSAATIVVVQWIST